MIDTPRNLTDQNDPTADQPTLARYITVILFALAGALTSLLAETVFPYSRSLPDSLHNLSASQMVGGVAPSLVITKFLFLFAVFYTLWNRFISSKKGLYHQEVILLWLGLMLALDVLLKKSAGFAIINHLPEAYYVIAASLIIMTVFTAKLLHSTQDNWSGLKIAALWWLFAMLCHTLFAKVYFPVSLVTTQSDMLSQFYGVIFGLFSDSNTHDLKRLGWPMGFMGLATSTLLPLLTGVFLILKRWSRLTWEEVTLYWIGFSLLAAKLGMALLLLVYPESFRGGITYSYSFIPIALCAALFALFKTWQHGRRNHKVEPLIYVVGGFTFLMLAANYAIKLMG